MVVLSRAAVFLRKGSAPDLVPSFTNLWLAMSLSNGGPRDRKSILKKEFFKMSAERLDKQFTGAFKTETALGQQWFSFNLRGKGWERHYRRVLFVPMNQEFIVEKKTRTLIKGFLEIEKSDMHFSVILFPLNVWEITLRFGRDFQRY